MGGGRVRRALGGWRRGMREACGVVIDRVWVPFFAGDGVARGVGFSEQLSLARGAPGTRGLARVAGAVRAQQEAQGGGGMGRHLLPDKRGPDKPIT